MSHSTKMPSAWIALATGLVLAPLAQAAISYVKVTNDADSGISLLNTYTHKIDFSNTTAGAALINGVQFDGSTGNTPNFTRTIANGGASNNSGSGIVTTTGGLANLMQGFLFNNNPATNGTGLQTYTVSGLTAGKTYDARIYSHLWTNPGFRPNTLVFDPDGAGGISHTTGVIDQDDSTTVGFSKTDSYYINYRYTAVPGENLIITAANSAGSNASWHLYGFSNQEVVLPAIPEPSSSALALLTAMCLVMRRRRVTRPS